MAGFVWFGIILPFVFNCSILKIVATEKLNHSKSVATIYAYYQSERLLVLLSQQVIDGLNRIECTERYFYKHCIPVAHSAIP